jgi:hypothetical protein
MSLHQLAHLLLRELYRVFEEGAVRFQDKLDHAFWILAASFESRARPSAMFDGD